MRNRYFFFLALLPLAAACMARDGSGQQPANTPQSSDTNHPVLNKTLDVVLPVTVRDKKGALVPSLQSSDFTLTEDGRPQSIKSLTQGSTVPLRIGLLIETNHAVSGASEAER